MARVDHLVGAAADGRFEHGAQPKPKGARSASAAIDRCGVDLEVGTDIDGESRPRDLGWDAGSDETAAPLFADSFESGDLSTWSSST